MYYATVSLLWLAIATSESIATDNAAGFGPPSDSDPLTWGFHATPEKPADLEIEGEFLFWLSGSLYRGAAGTWDRGKFTAEHWFDGFSRNHQFVIDQGSVTYRSRNASDELADFVQDTGRYPGGSFGGDPCKIIFGAFEVTFRDGLHAKGGTSGSNVPVGWIGNFPGLSRNSSNQGAPYDTLVMTTEGNRLQQIDPVDLEPIELFSYQANDLALNESGRMASHGAHDDEGSMYNYNLILTEKPPVYQVFAVQAITGEAKILATINDAPPAYIHSIFSTENYLILIIWQADYTKKGATILSSLGPWNPDRKTLFYVIDRKKGGIVSKYASKEAFFAFHQINSFEDENGDITVDLPTMADYGFLTAANVTSIRKNLGDPGASEHDVPGNFTRYRLPMAPQGAKFNNGTLRTQHAELVFMLDFNTSNIELPRVNEAYNHKPYRYAYGVHIEQPGYFTDFLIKIDTHTQNIAVWNPVVKQVPCEPIFVPAPNGQAEDDGILSTVVMDSSTKKSALVAINATTMEEMGRAKMPMVMGYGFHGAFGSNDFLSYY